jgi:hypothetical protein
MKKLPTAWTAHKVRCRIALLVMLAFPTLGLAQNGSPNRDDGSADEIAARYSWEDPVEAHSGESQDQSTDSDASLQIEPTELPETYLQAPYHFKLTVKGNYVPLLHWSVLKGTLPPGIRLLDDGTLEGQAAQTGEFQLTIAVHDDGQPPQALQRAFVIKVVDAITIGWKVPAHVNGSRIEGSVEVSNLTQEDIDLTFDVKAIAHNGRATEIGYQHFVLTKGTLGMDLPFGENLPNGGYIVNVNVVGEVPKRNIIYRQQMQTPGHLHVNVGP